MHKLLKSKLLVLVLLLIFAFSLSPSAANANHSWGNYHWPRPTNPFGLMFGKNLSSSWIPYLSTTSNDWSLSSVIDTSIVSGLTSARRCRPTNGRVEVCNYKYGKNGWLGLAQVWLNGDHITQGITKLNDSYFTTSKYNTSAWKNLVMCQEVGHTLGLDHQDEDFDNLPLGTCMDYSNDPTLNQHPNSHDYEQLETIYAHLESTASTQQSTMGRGLFSSFKDELLTKTDWGKEMHNNRAVALFERDFGKGQKVLTFVIWAQE